MLSEKEVAYYEEQYRKLKFTNDFMFGKIMENNPDICRKLLNLILKIDAGKIEFPETQKSFSPSNGGKGVRLDVFLKDQEGTVYDIEMQTVNKYDILQRSRYYRTVIDSRQLDPGDEYKIMKKTFMIFIFTFNLKNTDGYCIRSFQSRYDDPPHKALEDGFIGVFVNPYGKKDLEKLSDTMKAFLEYIRTGIAGPDRFVQTIEGKVTEARKNILWGHEYMTFQVKMNEYLAEGIQKGISLGEKRGREEAKTETARNLLKEGISVSVIAKTTGLSLKEIEAL